MKMKTRPMTRSIEKESPDPEGSDKHFLTFQTGDTRNMTLGRTVKIWRSISITS